MAELGANELPKTYDPSATEGKWYAYWLEKNYFQATGDTKKTPYTIVIPPPNVTGVLHMGHALNDTIQDIIIRQKRMQGYDTLWMPGTDHAGIATQNVVERKLAKEKITKEDLGRDAFIEKVWEWKHHHGNTIISQLKRMGCSCDWSRERFTMDEGLSKAVRRAFHDLYHEGLIYRGNYIINWCPRCETALADEEAEHKDVQGALYHIRYQVEGSQETIVVATTRPETMFGDTAVAMNPNDARYKHLKGKKVILPILNKPIPMIEDEHVDPAFGTGLVKVTPAHDPNDFAMGVKHKLEMVSVMTGRGVMQHAGPYDGMDRFACRKALIEDLRTSGVLEKVEVHNHAVGHCYRCDTVVEPRASQQWFVKMKPLAEKALAAEARGEIQFHPDKWRKIFIHWLDQIRDWCISRQIWWGHRIPVWYCQDCHAEVVTLEDPTQCTKCQSKKLKQDADVLDTWFSSWLWPFSTLGWPENTEDLKKFYPTQTLVSAPDIIFFWVARMIMAGLQFKGQVPFRDIYLHGIVRDDQGRKMSKSLGNAIDPVQVIEEFSADALRFSLVLIAPSGQDVHVSQDKFLVGRNFSNKIWNAARYLLMNISPDMKFETVRAEDLKNDVDVWIYSRLQSMVHNVTQALEKFRFNDAATAIYDFLWHDFCDWYLEMIKDRIGDAATQKVAVSVLETTMRALHPFMPFVTEEVWQRLPMVRSTESIVIAPWPTMVEQLVRVDKEEQFANIQDVIQTVRNIRRELNIPLKKELDVVVSCLPGIHRGNILNGRDIIIKLARVGVLTVDVNVEKPANARAEVRSYGDVYVIIAGAIDTTAEKQRLEGELATVHKEIDRLVGKLENKGFLDKAPESVVAKEREKLDGYQQLKVQILEQLAALK